MADFIVLRLVPKDPVPAEEFADYIENLSFDVQDISFDSAPGGDSIVTSGGFSEVLQHQRNLVPPPFDPVWELRAVATAVVQIDLPSPEFRQPDVRLVVFRGGSEIARIHLGYNVATFTSDDPPSTDPEDEEFRFIPAQNVAAYIPLRDPALDGVGFEIPEDGSPPRFSDLMAAVSAVVQQDPGAAPGEATETTIADMTPARARHVASEIIWNREIAPLPAPGSIEALEEMYTGEGNNQRQEFEAELVQFRAENESRAAVLGQYVFALAAALRAQRMSVEAEQASLRFPVRPGAEEHLPGRREEVEVIVRNP